MDIATAIKVLQGLLSVIAVVSFLMVGLCAIALVMEWFEHDWGGLK